MATMGERLASFEKSKNRNRIVPQNTPISQVGRSTTKPASLVIDQMENGQAPKDPYTVALKTRINNLERAASAKSAAAGSVGVQASVSSIASQMSAKEQEDLDKRRPRGRISTLLTGANGLLTDANVARKTLLGR